MASHDRDDVVEVAVYRWVCPICDKQGMARKSETGAGASPLNTLKNHVFFTADKGHGPEERLPADWPEEALADYIEPV